MVDFKPVLPFLWPQRSLGISLSPEQHAVGWASLLFWNYNLFSDNFFTNIHFLWVFTCSQMCSAHWGKYPLDNLSAFLSVFLDPKHGKSSVVSSLDCLSSIVERISTDNSTCPILPPVETVAEGSPCSPAEGVSLSDSGAQIPSPTNCTPLPQDNSSSNPIYQVL